MGDSRPRRRRCNLAQDAACSGAQDLEFRRQAEIRAEKRGIGLVIPACIRNIRVLCKSKRLWSKDCIDSLECQRVYDAHPPAGSFFPQEGSLLMSRSYTPRRLECSGFSCTGAVRKSNADEFLMVDMSSPFDAIRYEASREEPANLRGSSHGQLLLVADGIGSGGGGELASRLVVDTAQRYFKAQSGRRDNDQSTLGELVAMLHRSQEDMSREANGFDNRPIGTTVTAACLLGSTLHVLHAGDSRCYLLRDGKLRLLTTDHNLAQQMVESHYLTPAAARESGLHHVLWNAITADSKVFTLDTIARKLRDGDLLLLCTDGLNKHLTDADILAILDSDLSPRDATRRLVDSAMEAGGTDNITVVVARYHRQSATPVPSSASVATDWSAPDSGAPDSGAPDSGAAAPIVSDGQTTDRV